MTAREIMEAFRAKEAMDQLGFNIGIVALIDEDETLARLVLVWPGMDLPPDPDPHEVCPSGITATMQMRWLFSRIEPDPVDRWIELAGLPDAPHVRRACQVAIDNKIVLADGKLSKAAETWTKRAARKVLVPRTSAGG